MSGRGMSFGSWIVVSLLAIWPAGGAVAGGERPLDKSITVSASGEISVEPDLAYINTGVTSEAVTARDALSANSALMKKVTAGLKAAGIQDKDLTTTSFQVNPRYTRSKSARAPEIDGYTVTNQLRVTVRDLDNLGAILDKVVSLGSNQMGGLTFGVSKAETLKDEARKEAIANARRRAELYAGAAGASVGDVLHISEEAAHVAPRGGVQMARMSAEAVPIERGSQTLSALVTVTWALK